MGLRVSPAGQCVAVGCGYEEGLGGSKREAELRSSPTRGVAHRDAPTAGIGDGTAAAVPRVGAVFLCPIRTRGSDDFELSGHTSIFFFFFFLPCALTRTVSSRQKFSRGEKNN